MAEATIRDLIESDEVEAIVLADLERGRLGSAHGCSGLTEDLDRRR